MSDENKNWTAELLAEISDPWDEKELIRKAEVAAEDAQTRATEIIEDSKQLLVSYGSENDRNTIAFELLNCLVPNFVDLSLWRAVALGENVRLPASDQYGPISARLKQSDEQVRASASQKVHNKGEAPSQFLKRQGTAIAAAAREETRLEAELEVAKQRRQTLEAGTKIFAAVCLKKAIRDAAAPVFAMGPGWTVLQAIAGKTGMEVSLRDQPAQTQKILVTLHALSRDEEFGQEIKKAILAVCERYSERVKAVSHRDREFSPYDYEDLLARLAWPEGSDNDDLGSASIKTSSRLAPHRGASVGTDNLAATD